MPRKSRIDAPGAHHHIIGREIERRRIFADDTDRSNFVDRVGGIAAETNTACCAWALIPNHLHLLLRTGQVPVTTVMRRLSTGHAGYFYKKTGMRVLVLARMGYRFGRNEQLVLQNLNWVTLILAAGCGVIVFFSGAKGNTVPEWFRSYRSK